MVDARRIVPDAAAMMEVIDERDRAIDENDRLLSALRQLRLDICEHATDTVWVGRGETGVDRISHILGDGDWYNEVHLKKPKA